MSNTSNIVKSAAEIADGEKRSKNSVIGEDQIEAKAQKILRIGGKWYKKATDPVTHQEALFDITPRMVIDDEGK